MKARLWHFMYVYRKKHMHEGIYTQGETETDRDRKRRQRGDRDRHTHTKRD